MVYNQSNLRIKSTSMFLGPITVIGEWIDYTGSADLPTTKQQMYAGGAENELEGTDAWWEDHQDLDRLNIVGQSDSTTRRRLARRYNDGTSDTN